ncbi:translation initiation factor IF-2-like [Vidua macroura]|uniref:translation initiation factor IF-2-like n=1 Tax=Vidua macroura TaxID=187451 RepID=UPI0023A82053|nr:translation initiation factor IF-2-like [Vidua macroura]
MNGSAGDSRASLPSQIRIQTNIPWHAPGLCQRSRVPSTDPRPRTKNTEKGAATSQSSPGIPPANSPEWVSSSSPPNTAAAPSPQQPAWDAELAAERSDAGMTKSWTAGHESGATAGGGGGGSAGGGHKLAWVPWDAVPPHAAPALGKRRRGHGGESRKRPAAQGRGVCTPPPPAAARCVGTGPTGAAIPLRGCLRRGAAPNAAPARPGCAPARPAPLRRRGGDRSITVPCAPAAAPTPGASPGHREAPTALRTGSVPRAPGASYRPAHPQLPRHREPRPGTESISDSCTNRSVPRAPGASPAPSRREQPPSIRSIPSPFSTRVSPGTGSILRTPVVPTGSSALRAPPGTGSLRFPRAPRASPEHLPLGEFRAPLSREPPRAPAASPSRSRLADGTYRPEVWRRREVSPKAGAGGAGRNGQSRQRPPAAAAPVRLRPALAERGPAAAAAPGTCPPPLAAPGAAARRQLRGSGRFPSPRRGGTGEAGEGGEAAVNPRGRFTPCALPGGASSRRRAAAVGPPRPRSVPGRAPAAPPLPPRRPPGPE